LGSVEVTFDRVLCQEIKEISPFRAGAEDVLEEEIKE